MSRPLVVLSLEPWDDVWRRNQYLVDGLLARDPGLRVLFVEPASDPVHDALSRRRPRRGAGLRSVPGRPRLQRLQLTKPLPRALGPASDRWLVHGLRRAVRRLGLHDPVLWVNDPGWAPALRTGWPALYDITDDWVLADRGGRTARRTHDNDAYLLAHAAEVVVCSTGLAASKGRVREVTLVPNAVDLARYREPSDRPADLPPGPVAVYVGTLHEDRTDVALVVATGAALADVGGTLVLVGPDALTPENRALLHSSPGVGVLGPRPYQTIPSYLQHAGALVVPHVVDAFTDSLDPIKLYEYLAVGRPVVSTPVAGFRDAEDDGVVVASGAAFTSAVHDLLAAPWTPSRQVDVPTWDDRVAAVEAVLARIPGHSGRGPSE
ncbi:glycosyltransferase [Mumia sp. DW29H23]|uniref:glycosyltransferase n=1 Tax=Mumia sp. DW29H23 TaxID=3421241 RepID=UPI003D68F5C3